MKKTAVLFCSLVLLSAGLVQSGLAQGRMRMSAEERAKMLKERLSLNDEQTKQVQTIYEESQKEMQEVFQNNMGDRGAMRKAMQDLNDKNDKKIEKLLTDDRRPTTRSSSRNGLRCGAEDVCRTSPHRLPRRTTTRVPRFVF